VPHTHSTLHLPSQVTVRFGDGAHSFLLWDGATMADLANRIGTFDKLHDGGPLSIDVEFMAPRSRAIPSARSHRPLTH
jgi:hypothetical protein